MSSNYLWGISKQRNPSVSTGNPRLAWGSEASDGAVVPGFPNPSIGLPGFWVQLQNLAEKGLRMAPSREMQHAGVFFVRGRSSR